jgi:5-carboxymethyl-2-hydroxymuconate isomerase
MYNVKLKPKETFSVGKIICVGKNYAAHIKEMNSEHPDSPVLFLKPATAILNQGIKITLPKYSKEVHHEVELALLVTKQGKNIPADSWHTYIGGAGIALDLTLRDLQRVAKEKGLPWSICKGFDGACPISDFVPIESIADIQNLQIELKVNDEVRQQGSTAQMLYKVDKLVSYISGIFTLEPGDVILTGTPAGVSKIDSGDRIWANIQEIGSITFDVQ